MNYREWTVNESDVPEVKYKSRAAFLPQLAGPSSAQSEQTVTVFVSVPLPYHSTHPPASMEARGENWRKRKREEVFACPAADWDQEMARFRTLETSCGEVVSLG